MLRRYAQLWLSLLLFAPCASAAGSDAEIFALIDALRPKAAAIIIDGDVSDWEGIPFFADSTGDAGIDPALDISSVAIAPLVDRLLIAVMTLGASPAPGAFFVEADFAHGPRLDFQIDLDVISGVHVLTSFDAFGQPAPSTRISGLTRAAGDQAIEIEIPYSALGPLLPASLADALDPAVHRSWVRAQISNRGVSGTPVDRSPSIASYRLLETPFPLDSALPTSIENAGATPVELTFPLEDRWFLGQGANGALTHGGAWSYDFALLDDNFDQSDPPLSNNNADYFGFGRPFFAPASGTVSVAIGANSDQPPFVPGFVNNEVQITLPDGRSVRLLHAKQGTTLVSVGQEVDPSVQIAAVGNSGFSFQTHLHVDVIDQSGTTHPVAFRNMEIALNPVNDPWLRRLESWEPRVGLFTTVPEPSPRMAGLAALLAIAFVARNRRRAGGSTDAGSTRLDRR